MTEYRIIIATRDSKVHTLRNGEIINVIELETPTCGIARVDRNLYVGQLNKKIHCFHVKGRKMYTIYTPHAISCISLMSLTRTRHFKGLLAALDNGEVRLYKGK
jgi:Bardet-Biedl syndrome 1 protein|mmetsp:Transcript_7485/g.944  ORF Transcript_7485/g.944 Transcript_7485/m.944 type:complete len:104 (+) Transcript_7485:699-1010(+)